MTTPKAGSAPALSPDLDQLRALFRDQALVTLVRRALNDAPGVLELAAGEIDDNGGWRLDVEVVPMNRHFRFHLKRAAAAPANGAAR